MAMANNDWCRTLGIEVPRLEAVRDHSEAIPYSLLLVALLERGEAMTLEEVAKRFEEAGIADQASALFSLKRCRPDRAPVYRVGDHYHLDPHNDDLDLWVFRLGLRPARVPRLQVVRPPPEPLPSANISLKIEELGAPWVHRDEPRLYELMQTALQSNNLLEIVVGSAPGWTDPWSRAQFARVVRGESQWRCSLIDEAGYLIDDTAVQRARIAGTQA